MAYEPKTKVVDTRGFAENLLSHIAENQLEALEWASDGDGLPKIAKFAASAAGRLSTVFPSLMVTRRSQASDTEDMVNTVLTVDLELMVSGRDADTVTSNSAKYAMAVESLIRNAPVQSLTAGGKVHVNGTLETVETDFAVLRGSTAASSQFLQITNFRATWVLGSSAR